MTGLPNIRDLILHDRDIDLDDVGGDTSAESLGLGKYVAVGYGGNPTWIDPAATDWADVVANSYGWVQFLFAFDGANEVIIYAGTGAGTHDFVQVYAFDGGANVTVKGPDGARAVAATSGGVATVSVVGGSVQTQPLLELLDNIGTPVFTLGPDGSVGGVVPNVGDVIKWDGTKWIADAP